MSDFKVGDKAVLRPETKLYTFTKLPRGYSEREEELPEKITYMVEDFHKEQCRQYREAVAVLESDMKEKLEKLQDTKIGTLSVDLDLNDLLKDIDLVELRLSIFNAKPNRTLEEMQAIEKWLLNK